MRFHLSTAFIPTRDALEICGPAEEFGFSGMYLSDHLFYPRELQSKYTYTDDGSPTWTPDADWPDTWCLISAMAARTTRMLFTTGVYIAPARDLITVAKAVGTAAVIAEDRVRLGIAAGWCREEFELTGQDFDSRGRRLNDMIPALRALWRPGWVEYHGEYYEVPPMRMNPVPSAPVPILAGGLTDIAMRRATALCDGWVSGPAPTLDDTWRNIARLNRFREESGRADEPFLVYMAVAAILEPNLLEDLAGAGVTDLVTAPWAVAGKAGYAASVEEKLDHCARFAASTLR